MNQLQKTEILPETVQDINTYVTEIMASSGCNLPHHHYDKFFSVCRIYNLNPVKKEIYGIPYKKKNGEITFSIIVGYEVYIKRADSSGKLKGWSVVTDGEGANMKAVITIHRSDFDAPFIHEVYFDEYAQYTWNDGKKVLNSFWKSKPRTMLKKVAISQGFRLCFTEYCGGLPYIREEIESEPEIEQVKRTPFDNPVSVQSGEPETQPEPEKNLTPYEMRQIVNQKFAHEKSADFFRAKKWLSEGEDMSNMSDNQIKRLHKNIDTIFSMFQKWLNN